MINQELIQYIQQSCTRGDTKETIAKVLAENGWNSEDIEEGLKYYDIEKQPQTAKTEKSPVISNEDATQSFSWSVQKKLDNSKKTTKLFTTEKEKPHKDISEQLDKRKTGRIVGTIVATVLFVGVLGVAGYYVFIQKNLFGPAPLKNENVLSNVIGKISTITTANYHFSMEVGVNPRTADAKPLLVSNEELLKYKRDEDRMRDIQHITDKLNTIYNQQQFQIIQSKINSGVKNILTTPKYPASLSDLSVKTTDPTTGIPYGYTTNASIPGYSLTVTFETQEAVDSFSPPSYYNTSDATTTTNGKTITITNKDYFYASRFSGKPAQPKLFGLFDLEGMETYLSADTKGKMFISGTVNNSKEIPLDAKIVMGGDASFGDANFSFEAEGIKKGDTFFGVVHKLPTFFSSLGQVRGTWVMMTKDDLLSFMGENIFGTTVPSSQNEVNERLNKQREQGKILLRIADEEGIVTIASGQEKVKEDGENMSKYKLSLVKEKLLPFYERATKELESYGKDSILPRNEKIVTYLKGDDFLKTFDYLKANTLFTLLVDKNGFPAKMEIDVRYIPSDEVVSLKEKQIDLITTISFKDINKPIVVEEPKTYITIYEMLSNMTGQSKTAILSSKQTYNVNSIRSALSSYYSWAGKYPNSLEELKQKRKDVPITAGSEYQSSYNSDYYKDLEFLKNIPIDIFVKKPFQYSVQGKDYQLVYQMEIDPYTKDKDPRSYYTESRVTSGQSSSSTLYSPSYTTKITAKFINGINTANKTTLSVEAENVSADDDDHDGLPNILEILFGTDPKKVDTDGDGFSDTDELKAGTDPTGPGKLKFKNLYHSPFF